MARQNCPEFYGSTGENATRTSTVPPLSHSIEKGKMIALIQRVSRAQVTVRSEVVASASRGILALIGIAATDSIETGARLIDRVLGYRIFADEAGKMNLSIRDIDGDLVLVPQFTLVAETSKGNRPGFSGGASPDQARALYGKLLMTARTLYPKVASGVFGADMQVELVNDGPATFWLEARNGA